MAPFHSGRILETAHHTSLGIDASHHMLDNPVLAGTVHRLQNHQQGIGLAGVKHLLQLSQQFDAFFKLLNGLLLAVLVQLAQIPRIMMGQFKSLAVRHTVRLNELLAAFDQMGRNFHNPCKTSL